MRRARPTRLFMIGFMMTLAVLVFSSTHARASFWDFFFPKKAEDTAPTADMKAPFANEDVVIEDMDEFGNEIIDLSERHRTSTIITGWVQDVVPQLLSYTAANYQTEFREKSKNFASSARNEYVAFLQKQNLINTLKSGRYNINGFVTDYPVIINERTLENRYRWLYRTKVMVTFIEANKVKGKVYSTLGDDPGHQNPVSREYTLTFQLGRDQNADNPHGLKIESWNIKKTQK